MPTNQELPTPDARSVDRADSYVVLEYLAFQGGLEEAGRDALRGFCGSFVDRISGLDADHLGDEAIRWFRDHIDAGCKSCGPAFRRVRGELGPGPRARGRGTCEEGEGAPGADPGCRLVHDRLPDYLDGTMETKDWLPFTEHVQACETCFDLVEAMEMTLYLAAAELRSRPDDPCDDVPAGREPISDGAPAIPTLGGIAGGA